MNKKIKGSAIAALLVAGTTAFTAMAAIPEFTAVLGEKAYDLNYLNFKATEEEQDGIVSHIVANKPIYIKTMSGEWVDNLTGDAIETSEIPQVVYKDAEGAETVYAAEDGDKVTEADKLEVKEIEVLNLKQFKVEFTKPVEAVTAANFELSAKATAKLVDGENKASVTLSDDKMSAVVTFVKNAEQQEVMDITVKGVKDLDGNTMEKVVVEDVKFMDMEIPEVTGVDVVGKDTIKVTFTEPMNVDGKDATSSELREGVTLVDSNGKKNYVSKVEFLNNNTEANVKFYSDLKEGTYELTVNNKYKDYAGYTVVKHTESVDVVIDKEAPVIAEVVSANELEVVLMFNEDLDKSYVEGKKELFYHTNSNNKAESVTVDGKKVTIKFAKANKMPSGTVYLYYDAKAVKDLWGNVNEQLVREELEVKGDNEAPEITEVKAVAQNKLQVTFSEAVTSATAKDKDNYTLLDKDGKEIEDAIRSITVSTDNKKATIETKKALNGDYTLVVEGVKDELDNAMGKVSVEFTVADVTAPSFDKFSATLTKLTETSQIIVVDFDDVMKTEGEDSVLDLSNYQVKVQKDGKSTSEIVSLNSIKDYVEIEAIAGDEKVQITLDNKGAKMKFVTDNDDTTDEIELGRVSDAAGNVTTALSGGINVKETSTVGYDKLEATAADTFVLTVSDELVKFSNSDFVVNVGGTVTTNFEIEESVVSGKTVLTFTLLDKKFNADATVTGGNVTVKMADNSEAANQFGMKLLIDADKDVAGVQAAVVTDKIAPSIATKTVNNETVKDITVENNKITINFNEGIKTSDANRDEADFVIEAEGTTLVAGKDYVVTIDGTKAIIELIGNFAGDITVKTTETVNYITDEAGNKLAKVDFSITKANMPVKTAVTTGSAITFDFFNGIKAGQSFGGTVKIGDKDAAGAVVEGKLVITSSDVQEGVIIKVINNNLVDNKGNEIGDFEYVVK